MTHATGDNSGHKLGGCTQEQNQINGIINQRLGKTCQYINVKNFIFVYVDLLLNFNILKIVKVQFFLHEFLIFCFTVLWNKNEKIPLKLFFFLHQNKQFIRNHYDISLAELWTTVRWRWGVGEMNWSRSGQRKKKKVKKERKG